MAGSKMLGILFADDSKSGLTHAYFSGILNGFKKEAEKRGYDIAFLNCNKDGIDRKAYMEQIRERKYEGVLIACINFADEEVIEILESDIPVVTIDEETKKSICVKSDNVMGLKNLVNYLIDMGHQKIAYITGDNNTVTGIRVNSFLETCKNRGISIPEEYIRQGKFRDMRKASFQTEELLRLPEPPTCIMYCDDYAAIGGINVLHARGLQIAKDISLTGFDGIDILSQYEPRLTTVKQNTELIGSTAAEALLNYIADPKNYEKKPIVIETKLEKGATVGKCYIM